MKNRQEILIPEVKEVSTTQEAVIYRNMNRKFVDELFEQVHEKVKLPNGKYKFARSRAERNRLDIKARNLWRTIIMESNKL